MKRMLLVVSLVAAIAGCGEQGAGPDAWQESMPLSSLQFTELRQSDHVKVTGVVANQSGGTATIVRIYFKAYAAGDALLDTTVVTVYDLAAGASASFTAYIDDAGQTVARWEYWVEWQTG